MLTKELLAKIRKIEIRSRRVVDELTGGAYRSVYKGHGIEFSEVREYISGDDVRDIDWNVTARTGIPYIKKYSEERELNVLLAVDISRSCAFGSNGVEKKEKIAEAAAMLALSAVRNHDKVGLLLFSDQPERYLPPRSGRTHILRLIRELLTAESERRGTDIRSALQTISRSLKKKTVIFLMSDFDVDLDFERDLKILAGRHDVALMRITDRLERHMPAVPGLNLKDAESGSVMALDFFFGGSRRRFESAAADLAQQIRDLAVRSKVDLIELDAADDLVKPLMAFFEKRERRHTR